MYREKIRDVESFKSDEFKGLKEKNEELLYGTRNSEAVRGVQNFLNENGYTDQNDEKLTVNGRYEANTANAVIKYQKDNNLTVDGIVGDETWNSIYNRKKKKEEEVEKSSSENWRNTGTTEKNMDVWNTPKTENLLYKPGTKQEIWGRKRSDREQMPWEAIGQIQGGNTPNKPGEPWREKMPDAQAKPWQRSVPNSRGQMPRGSYAPRERNPRDINMLQERNANDESKAASFFPSDYNLQNLPPYIKNALAYTDKTGETGAKEQPLTGGVKQAGINAHFNFPPDSAMKNAEKKVEAENPYILPLSERTNEALGEYEPAGEYLADTKSEEKEETNWLWDYIRNPKEAVIRFAKEAGKTIDEAQKELQRNVWKYGADNFLKKREYYVSAHMLEHSLQDNPTGMLCGNESDIAKLIKKDPVYLEALDNAIANSDGKTIDVPLKNIQFDTDDLYYSIHKATIHVKGYKNKDGKWIINAMLEDTYDFTEWMTVKFENGKLSFDISTGTVANDAAKISQNLGAVNPYKIRVYFNTVR